ncbi:putative entry exclusion protein TrbK-alt [Caulobacter sp. RHG1]|uniref:putative entry exclusion protein TrbK-alt n=1 Tax=Caulobacter sp. (strain RHG1) TaxID=2545762 RepID=UPI00155549A4|nr:putative entry exclusion protein TrbK-alt [Caulobacter sp. RHG1]NQE63612.1 hypothetical protein [Caulobacter sp. RHG1]
MSARLGFRLAAAGFALLAILVAALQARHPAPPAPNPRPAVQTATPVDARLARCQALGAAGAQDPDCLRAWDAARNRFLGKSEAGR